MTLLRAAPPLLVGILALAACGKDKKGEEPAPAPSSSVISLAVGFGGCPDIAICEKECAGGSADRCRRLGVTYQFGQGAPKDEAKATGLFVKACDLKNAPACVAAGQMYEFEHGVPKDEAKAASFYAKGCDMGWGAACYNLAIMYERGRGVAKDEAKAVYLFQVACTDGSKSSCEKVRELRARIAEADAAPAWPPLFDAGPLTRVDGGAR